MLKFSTASRLAVFPSISNSVNWCQQTLTLDTCKSASRSGRISPSSCSSWCTTARLTLTCTTWNMMLPSDRTLSNAASSGRNACMHLCVEAAPGMVSTGTRQQAAPALPWTEHPACVQASDPWKLESPQRTSTDQAPPPWSHSFACPTPMLGKHSWVLVRNNYVCEATWMFLPGWNRNNSTCKIVPLMNKTIHALHTNRNGAALASPCATFWRCSLQEAASAE